MPRVLYVPMYSSPGKLITCSSYNWSKILMRTIVENDPEAFVYFPVPEGYENDLRSIEHPRILRFPVEVSVNQYMESSRLQDVYIRHFNDMEGPYHPDIVIVDKTAQVPALKNGLNGWLTRVAAPRVFVTKTVFVFYRPQHDVTPELEALQSLGFASSDMTLWMNERDFEKKALPVAEKWLSPDQLKEIVRSKRLGGWMANMKAARRYAIDPMDKPREPITLSWAVGGTAGYHVKEVMEVYDKLFKANPKIRILVTCPSQTAGRAFRQSMLGKESAIEDYYGLPQEQYLEKVSKAHAFVLWMKGEGLFSASAIELQMMGLIGVFPAGRQKPSTLMPDYPYLFNTQTEMFHVLKYVTDNYFGDEVQEVIRKQKQYVEENYDTETDCLRIYNEAKEMHRQKGEALIASGGERQKLMDLLWECTAGLPELTMPQLRTLIREKASTKFDMYNLRELTQVMTTPGQLRFLMTQIGFKDDCQTKDVRFVRA